MADIKFVNATKKFGDVVAVNNLNLEVADQEFVSLVGPSGCGKSTTLAILAGLEEATSGDIYIGGKLMNDVPPGDRNIAMMFQSYALYPHMNVYKNMSFGLRIRRVARTAIEERVQEVARLLEIEDLLTRKPAQLSGGQRQRVALGRAIVRDPDVFLLDEPLSNLDAILRVQMRAELSLLFRRLGSTVIYVTHDQAEAMTMSDRMVVFRSGEVRQIGTPMEVYEKPANKFVARFIGSPPINLIDGQIVSEAGKHVFQSAGLSLPLPQSNANGDMPQAVTIGIRPEDVSLKANGGLELAAGIRLVEHLGSETILFAEVQEQMITFKTDKAASLKAGDNVTLNVSPTSLHVFDAKSERRIELT